MINNRWVEHISCGIQARLHTRCTIRPIDPLMKPYLLTMYVYLGASMIARITRKWGAIIWIIQLICPLGHSDPHSGSVAQFKSTGTAVTVTDLVTRRFQSLHSLHSVLASAYRDTVPLHLHSISSSGSSRFGLRASISTLVSKTMTVRGQLIASILIQQRNIQGVTSSICR